MNKEDNKWSTLFCILYAVAIYFLLVLKYLNDKILFYYTFLFLFVTNPLRAMVWWYLPTT